MPKSQASKERRRRHKDMPAQIKDNGVRVDIGDVDEIAHHYRRHFHQFLDYLTIDPSAPTLWIRWAMVSLRCGMPCAGLALLA